MGLEKLANPNRRVVITGLGVCTPQGRNVPEFWRNMLEGKSSIRIATKSHPYLSQYRVKVGSLFDGYEIDEKKINYDFRGIDRKETGRDRMSMYTQMALEAASEAIRDSKFLDDDVARYRAGTSIGTGFGGMIDIENSVRGMVVEGMREQLPKYLEGRFSLKELMAVMDDEARMNEMISIGMGKKVAVDPKIAKRAIPGDAAATIARFYGLHAGNAASGTTACSSGHTNLINGVYYIMGNKADVMVVGGSQEVSPLIVSGFGNVRALSPNADPLTASRPFDKDRNGFVIGEGAGVLVLEEYEHARRREAKIYAEVLGFGEKLDSKHATAPREDVFFSSLAMREALWMADLNPEDIDYINPHGTSTGPNDKYESLTIKEVFGEDTRIPVSSSKGAIGHGLNMCSAIELAVGVLSIRDNVVHPTVGLKIPDRDSGCTLDYVIGSSKDMSVRNVLSNAAAFGGRNSAVILGEYRN